MTKIELEEFDYLIFSDLKVIDLEEFKHQHIFLISHP